MEFSEGKIVMPILSEKLPEKLTSKVSPMFKVPLFYLLVGFVKWQYSSYILLKGLTAKMAGIVSTYCYDVPKC